MVDRLFFICLLAVALLSGCSHGESAKPQAPEGAPRASVALRVLVVNESLLAEAINRLRGEWAERSGGEFSAAAGEWKEVSLAKSLEEDVIVFPSRYLGELMTRGWLQPMRTNVLEGEEFKADDVYPLVRRELMRWGGDAMALPLGIQQVLPGKSHAEHPGLSFLALAASNAVTSEREAVLFDPETMKPRIVEDVFVNALLRMGKVNAVGKGEAGDRERVVPVLGFNDRMIAVSRGSRNAASAFRLAAWLASPDVSSQLLTTDKQLQSVRRSKSAVFSKGSTEKAIDKPVNSAVAGEAALMADRCLLVPRIPGVDEYISVLDDAVKTPPTDRAEAEAALKKVAAKWEKITDAHGREVQRKAYLKDLQISE